MQIRAVPIDHPDAAALVEEVQQLYVELYGGRDLTPITPDEFAAPHGEFLVGYVDDRPVATGAWRRLTLDALGSTLAAEIKRMYVVPDLQRRGLARQLLAGLEQSAAAAGREVMVLETGIAQPDAIALYTSSGYVAVPGFGFHREAPESRCFARRIDGDGPALWDAEAADFDREPDHGLGDPVTRAAWRDLLLEALPPAPARVADLGCGTGTLAALLAGDGYDVTGLDFSPAMLERARAKAPGVAFRLGDANAPDLPAASYDAVLVRHVLWAMRDPADAVRRWRDLLVDGGVLVLVEGRWRTGAGLTADQVAALVRGAGLVPTVRPMPEPVFWGSETGDERFLVVARG